jgi:hypothetical protein
LPVDLCLDCGEADQGVKLCKKFVKRLGLGFRLGSRLLSFGWVR